MRRNRTQTRRLSSPRHQGKLVVLVGGLVILVACAAHLILGASLVVVLVAGLTAFVSVYPLALYGVMNIGAVVIVLVGLRYVGFPLVAKLAMGQPLDSNLVDPLGSFGLVMVGLLGYLLALLMSSKARIGRPILHKSADRAVLQRISFLSAGVGIAANLALAFNVGTQTSGVTFANFFTTFLHLALIAGVAGAIQASKGQKSVDLWVAALLVAEVTFAFVRNSRLVLLEAFLILIATNAAFKARINWRQLAQVAFAVVIMVVFVTPVFFRVRSVRGDLSWTERIGATFDSVSHWPQTLTDYLAYTQQVERSGLVLDYYGSPQNVFDRMSFVNHVDVLKAGTEAFGTAGLEDLRLAIIRALPRYVAPSKPVGYSQGFWLYGRVGVSGQGPYPTAPLIATGFEAFGWIGVFIYPWILGLTWLLIVKKVSGFSLQGNIWAIYLLFRIQNQFVEGSTDAYVVYVLRMLPQDLIVLWLIQAVSFGRLALRTRRKGILSHGS